MFPTELQPPRAPHHTPRRGGGNQLGSLGSPRTGSPYSLKLLILIKLIALGEETAAWPFPG